MPWLGLSAEVIVGPVNIWPYSKYASQYIHDHKTREHLDAYFQCYVDAEGRSVDSVCVCTIGSVDFRMISDSEHDMYRKAANILCFTSICSSTADAVQHDNRSCAPPQGDSFQVYCQRFSPGDRSIALSFSDGIVGGYEFPECTFQKPMWIRGRVYSESRTLLPKLADLLSLKKHSGNQKRLFNCLDWFRISHLGGDAVPQTAKVIAHCTSYESLIPLPGNQKKIPLMREVEKRLKRASSYYCHVEDKKGNKHKCGYPARFIGDLYGLRNDIVHGKKVNQKRFRYSNSKLASRNQLSWLTKLIVSDMVLYELVFNEAFPAAAYIDKLEFNLLHKALAWAK